MSGMGTKNLIKRFIATAIKPYVGRKNRKLSAILNYHSINPTHKFATKPKEFRQQMEYLKSNFQVVSLLDFYKLKKTEKDLPNKLAMVTFDDGYKDNYEYAFPILSKFGIKATVFVTTGFINGDIDITKDHIAYRGLNSLTWEQIKQMSKSGILFGAHTHTHRILTEISPEDAEGEITKSRKILEKQLGKPVEMFAYPLGQRKTFNTQIIRLLKKHHFKMACSTIWGSDNSNIDILALRRIRIDAIDTMDDFKQKINGHWDFVKFFQMIRC
jgi:peptidoglycan/xylan/chitin deacetylase (PgdA/CDA1 family)